MNIVPDPAQGLLEPGVFLPQCCPSTKLTAISVKPEHEKSAHEFGADGFISMQLSPDVFLSSLNAILTKKENVMNKDHSFEK